ncbi:hypothetical protein K443DRAFT_15013 [Laccaria amethystina LaAM-08-1]|uniref:Uncharacterized protein n=1 Tax=Laccaria amethystina LaAM-08-1 TaxID=1095629 RepID=A0A0C9WLY0_9AGAR|nr:hypothetical protein K443DRAFT_15013 [Laccaria amethystina LaAM-08-1]
MTTSFSQDPIFIPTAGPSVDPPVFTPDELSHAHLSPPPVGDPLEAASPSVNPPPSIPPPSPARILAEPPSSMKPLPNPRFALQMRPIFTDQSNVKAKLNRQFLELNPSTPRSSTTSKSKRACKAPQPRIPVALTTMASASSVSSSPSSPSPFQAINVTDSKSSSDVYCTPVKRRKLPTGNSSRTTASLTSSTILGEDKRWPSDYPVRDVIHVLHSCKPPPSRTTIAQHFYSLTGIPFKSLTYYDA